jgi:simple sugar transport system substrate-binding protein
MTQTNKIGYIGSFPIPEVIQGINSAFLHARKVNPEVEMVVIWAYTWFDPAKEADAATAMIEQGVDVIMQHTDSTAPQAAAQEAGNVFTFGQASDMAQFKPTPRISSIIDNWAPYYIERVQAALDGTWTSTHTWGGIGDGEVQIGEITEGRARGGPGRGRGAARRHRLGRVPPLHRTHQPPGRHALAGRGRSGVRRGPRVHGLLRRRD